MTILTEGPRKAEFMISEAEDYRSRDEVTVTVPANTTLVSGTILAKITSTGKFVPHETDASPEDGSEGAAGILFEGLTNSTGSAVDFTATVVTRAAQVKQADLTYDDISPSPVAATDAALAALGIIVR